MDHYKEIFNKGKLAAYKQKRNSRKSSVSREELDQAMNDFLKRGGKIKRVETEWIEDGEIPVYR